MGRGDVYEMSCDRVSVAAGTGSEYTGHCCYARFFAVFSRTVISCTYLNILNIFCYFKFLFCGFSFVNFVFYRLDNTVVTLIGPFHIDLNADKDLVLNYHPFTKSLYESLFPSRVLAEKPKLWRIQFMLEISYGGWTLIRRTVKAVFHCKCKDLQYGTLLNFLNNYCPTVLFLYSILFKTNGFSNYYDSSIRMWVMMYCFRRHHYRKSLLIWLFLVKYWEGNNFSTDIFNLFNNHLNIIDESVVKYVHSVIQRQMVQVRKLWLTL